MIKEWCEKCEGRKGIYVQDDKYPTLAKLINCPNCNGLGYTELEPKWNGPANLFIVSEEQSVIQDRVFSTFKPIEVYIKELKE